MIYDKEQINEIKSKIDYFEFYKEYLPDLTQRGKLAWALCCFHNDKHPSLSVSLNYGIYRCWSCGEHGDVFNFIQKYHNLNFNEAVEFLAEKYNVNLEVSDEVKAQRERRKALININKTMSEKFQLNLERNNEAWNYLTQIRGFSPKIIQDFKLGCGIDNLPNKESLKILGLISTGERGDYTTFASNRVMIPRINEKGEVVSFTGRLYTDDKGSKYKHTINTEIYNKSEYIFGLYQAKKYIKHFNSAVLVEGECFKPDAEVLTPKGWVRFDQYNGEDVMQVDDNLNGQFVSPLARIVKDYDGELLECDGKNCKITATPNHNLVYIKDNKLFKKHFKDVSSKQLRIPVSINYSGQGVDLNDNMIKLLIAIQADGKIDYRKNGDKYIRICFKKERKIQRFEKLLLLNNIKYTKSVYKNGYTFFGFKCNLAFKKFPTDWLQMTQNQLQTIISEIVNWDGNYIPNRNQIEYNSKDYENAMFIQTISHLCNYSSSIMRRKNKFGEWYKVSILFGKNSTTIVKNKINTVKYTGKVYCVEVPSGRILVRINGKITVIGNCDVIKCHQKGIVNAVCLSGVTVDDKQINLLKKYTNTFYVCVEDGAILGENIIDKKQPTPLEKLYKSIKDNIPYAKVYIVDLRNKDGSKCDPDMYLEKHTREEFKDLLKRAKIYNEYVLCDIISKFNPKNIEDKTKCIHAVVSRLIEINNYLDRKQYIELVANKLMISENDIYRQIKYKTNSEDKLRSENITWDNKPVYAQKVLLSICLAPNFDYKKSLSLVSLYAENLMEPFYKNILNDIIKPFILSQSKNVDLNEMFTNVNHGGVDDIVKQTIINCYMKIDQFEDFTDEDLEELIQEQCETLKEWYIPQEKTDIEYTLQEELQSMSI